MISLRPPEDTDEPIFFEHQADQEWAAMAVFESRDREAHLAHWRRVQGQPQVINRTVVVDGEVCGSVTSWIDQHGRRLVGYGLGRAFWGRGIASAALGLYLEEVRERPLYAYVAVTNGGSVRVLEKCGFAPEGEPEVGEDGVAEQLYILR